MRNKVQLIAYADRIGAGNLASICGVMDEALQGLFGGVHLLPFYYPIDGSDAGFDPIDHSSVDSRLGSWDDVKALSRDYDVCADLIVNHISSDSPQFTDYLAHGDASEYAGMFLALDTAFEGGVNAEDMRSIYRPRPTPPYATMMMADGTARRFWTTFTSRQIDLDIRSPKTRSYLRSILHGMSQNGVTMVRLDAVGYAVKTRGTSCFMTPETYDFIAEITGWCHEYGMQVLAETHTHYRRQLKMADYVDYVYDFALPPLVLHTLFESNTRALKDWYAICPHNVINVLDTHDGIGVMDVGADEQNPSSPGLLKPEFIDSMVERIHTLSGGGSKRASRSDVGNLDLYQVNCTYFSALGEDEDDYLLARTIQLFSPGIPQIYYVGLFAGANDEELFNERLAGREINRGYFSADDIRAAVQKPVVQKLFELLRFRNTHPAFSGRSTCLSSDDQTLILRWVEKEHWAELYVDLQTRSSRITSSTDE